MYKSALLIDTWVLIAELSSTEKLLFMRLDSDIPPSRAPRQQWQVTADHHVRQGAAGKDDRIETHQLGLWQLQGDLLTLEWPQQQQKYSIAALNQEQLTLLKR